MIIITVIQDKIYYTLCEMLKSAEVQLTNNYL